MSHDKTPDPPVAAPAKDWLDEVLARARAPVLDDGAAAFTAAVMRRVAAQPKRLPAAQALAQVQRQRDREARQGRWNLAGAAVGVALAWFIAQLAEGSAAATLPGLPAWATLPAGVLLGSIVLAYLLVERRG